MKKIKFILAAMVAALVSFGAYAQEDGNRDANGYVVRGPYLTNGAGSNVFVGIGGGFNTSLGKEIKPLGEFTIPNNWGAEIFVGKWFTPTVGARFGYKGVMDNFAYDGNSVVITLRNKPYASGEQIRYGYVHTDLLWNVSNAISGYKETRFWDFVPYVGAGYLGINNGGTDNKFGVSAGLYNKIRLGKVVNLFVDVNIIASENPLVIKSVETGKRVIDRNTPLLQRPLYLPTATVGITFNLGKRKNFDRFSSVGVSKDLYENVTNENGDLKKRVGALEQENNELKNKLIEQQNKEPEKVIVKEETQVLVGSTVITFDIGSAELAPTELQKAELFAKSFSDKETLVKVVGSADSKTGSEKINDSLSQRRADVVKKVLLDNGVAEERIIVSTTLDATDKPETSRSAIITLTTE